MDALDRVFVERCTMWVWVFVCDVISQCPHFIKDMFDKIKTITHIRVVALVPL